MECVKGTKRVMQIAKLPNFRVDLQSDLINQNADYQHLSNQPTSDSLPTFAGYFRMTFCLSRNLNYR